MKKSRRHVAVSALLLATAACSSPAMPRGLPPTPAPTASHGTPSSERPALDGSKRVRFEALDGTRLEGRLFGRGKTGIVLSHMSSADQSDWFDFASVLKRKGYRVLTFNFRGYCPGGLAGCSQGDFNDTTNMWKDVLGGARLLHERGARRVTLMGASLGAAESLLAAARDQVLVDGVVWLSGSDASFANSEQIAGRVRVPKLFMTGRGDTPVLEPTKYMFEVSPRPKELEIVPVAVHGTEMLDETRAGKQAAVARRAILSFLDRHSTA